MRGAFPTVTSYPTAIVASLPNTGKRDFLFKFDTIPSASGYQSSALPSNQRSIKIVILMHNATMSQRAAMHYALCMSSIDE
jgi:hypothetical protein